MFISHLDKPRSHPFRIEIFNVHSFETIRQSLRVMLALYHRDSQTRSPAATGRQIIRLSTDIVYLSDFLLPLPTDQ